MKVITCFFSASVKVKSLEPEFLRLQYKSHFLHNKNVETGRSILLLRAEKRIEEVNEARNQCDPESRNTNRNFTILTIRNHNTSFAKLSINGIRASQERVLFCANRGSLRGILTVTSVQGTTAIIRKDKGRNTVQK